ncbi:hypothetical protein BRADI_4g19733v3 [Brachypodium distachyon]|uniref:Uncharacterized protein n=1 Tax=Brachypodium distachyon TaxID=15368 RepID=A0A2K2CNS6_BRADI|nr:hypothetical protein BRADI_4g19733v3 [Brachypodium distachyon]
MHTHEGVVSDHNQERAASQTTARPEKNPSSSAAPKALPTTNSTAPPPPLTSSAKARSDGSGRPDQARLQTNGRRRPQPRCPPPHARKHHATNREQIWPAAAARPRPPGSPLELPPPRASGPRACRLPTELRTLWRRRCPAAAVMAGHPGLPVADSGGGEEEVGRRRGSLPPEAPRVERRGGRGGREAPED